MEAKPQIVAYKLYAETRTRNKSCWVSHYRRNQSRNWHLRDIPPTLQEIQQLELLILKQFWCTNQNYKLIYGPVWYLQLSHTYHMYSAKGC